MSTEEVMNVTTTPKSLHLESSEKQDLLMAVIGILSFFSVIGTVGNALVLYVYVKKRNKLASTVFIITLAGTDFITCILIIPYTIVLEYMLYYIKFDVLCKLYMFLITSNVPFSAFIMMAIAVDRYLCICHPFSHILNKRIAKLVISVLAVIAFTLGIITALNYGVYTKIREGSENSYRTNDTSVSRDNLTYVSWQQPEVMSTTYDNGLQNISELNQVPNSSNGKSDTVILYDGFCKPNGLIFSHKFLNFYQKIYSSFFVIVIVVVVVLYILIYKFVSVRRAKRRRMRCKQSMYSSYKETVTAYNTRASLQNGSVKTEVDLDSVADEQRPKTEKTAFLRRMTIREKGLVANIRTAAMLFVVTAVFIIVFLPAWLMAHEVLPYNMLIFYMYFFYNVANPMIYAFMNKAFRRDLKDVIECSVSP